MSHNIHVAFFYYVNIPDFKAWIPKPPCNVRADPRSLHFGQIWIPTQFCSQVMSQKNVLDDRGFALSESSDLKSLVGTGDPTAKKQSQPRRLVLEGPLADSWGTLNQQRRPVNCTPSSSFLKSNQNFTGTMTITISLCPSATLPETNIGSENGGRQSFPFGIRPIFRCKLFVSGRVSMWVVTHSPFRIYGLKNPGCSRLFLWTTSYVSCSFFGSSNAPASRLWDLSIFAIPGSRSESGLQDWSWIDTNPYMGVSKNRGIPKWMIYNGKPY